ncbi:MAG TPA: DUF4062 domain-containing protein [Longimicrobiaceae bacterium]|nr:DUF4062 domain-containing protein [Longimicrobiaceae bacterium]
MKVFVSSTYLDLKEYRNTAQDVLRRLSDTLPVAMEFFPSSDEEPTALSLEQLDRSDAYLGIIGHRYGYMPDPKVGKSVTHLEYEHALKLHRERGLPLFLFLASDTAALPPYSMIEPDEIRKWHSAFREKLRKDHTPVTFESVHDFALKLLTDFRNRTPYSPHGEDDVFIFEEDQAKEVFSDLDEAIRERQMALEDLLRFMAERFQSIFSLDPTHLDAHPFFTDVGAQLRPFIPGVTVDESTGTLNRAKIRHIILRIGTLLNILKYLDERQLRECGQQIGKDAAADLVRTILESPTRSKTYVPASPRAFVNLWDYWDSTGGWGKITLLHDQYQEEALREGPAHEAEPTWHIRIRNSFLIVKNDLESTHRLTQFWCGYIHGFLDTALPSISEQMRNLSSEKRPKVMLPAYHRVKKVEHLEDSDVEVDVFKISFDKMPLSDALLLLAGAKNSLKIDDPLPVFFSTAAALQKARVYLGEERFSTVVAEMKFDPESRKTVAMLLQPIESISPPDDLRLAARCYSVAKEIIDRILS